MDYYNNYGAYYPNPYYNGAQERLSQLEQQYSQNRNAQTNRPQTAVIMPVNDEQEARSYPPDLSGGTQLFMNRNTGQIYSKQFNTKTALIDFEVYDKKVANPPEIENTPEPVNSKEDKILELENKIINLEKDFNNYVQSASNGTNSYAAEPANDIPIKSSTNDEPAGSKPSGNTKTTNTTKSK